MKERFGGDEVEEQNFVKTEIIEHVIKHAIPSSLLDDTTIIVNGTGRFADPGGPHADAGITGRKVIVDTYGGMSRHGGGAFSGKDPSKMDRSAAYAARWAAKHVVASGLAETCEIQLAYAIGVADPVSVSIDTFGTHKINPDLLEGIVRDHFNLKPAGIIKTLDLLKPRYSPTAAYGHFGRKETSFTWERTDKAKVIKKAAGL